VLRLLDKTESKFTLEGLGMSGEVLTVFDRLVHQPHGIVLVTGPTGSGKTTTLYASLGAHRHQHHQCADGRRPDRVRAAGIGQTQVNAKIDLTFAKALRAILRQDPDVIMIGEIRDYETAQIAIQASLTGHLVLATLHTNDAPSAVTRLTDMGVEPFLLSSRCWACWRSAWCASSARPAAHRTNVGWHPVGCAACGNTGYKGRTGVYELMVADDKVRALIHSRAAEAELFVAAQPRRHAYRCARTASASSRSGHHLAGSDAGHARLAPSARDARLQVRGAGRRRQAPAPGCSKPTTPRRRAHSCVRSAGAAGRHAGGARAGTERRRRGRGRRVFTPRRWRSGRGNWPAWSAGLPLERALTALADEAEDPAPARTGRAPEERGQRRQSLRTALGSAPREFDEVYCAVVAAGEQSGALGQVLEKLADDLEERQALRAKLMGAMLYPAIVSLIAIVIVVFLVTYVVPQVASVFTSSSGPCLC
jgi:energy-coupling factor transporter ATP-binding protein EcfA2